MRIHLICKNCANASINLGILAFVVCLMSVFPFSAQAGPILEIDETTYSAGEVYVGEVIEHRFLISNAGDAPLDVQRVRSS